MGVIIKLTLTLMTSLVPYVTAAIYVSDVRDYSRLESASARVFTDHVLSVSTSRNLAHCAQFCLRHSGNMFTLAVTSQDNCRCHSKVMTSRHPNGTSSVGARTFVPTVTSDWLVSGCTTSSDCPRFAYCLNNVCVCPYDTYYSDSLRLCIAYCPNNMFGTRMLPYYNYGLIGYNSATYANSTIQACQQLCINASFVCSSFEWRFADNSCWLQTTDFIKTPTSVKLIEPGWTYYQRSCT